MKFLLTGAGGQLGTAFQALIPPEAAQRLACLRRLSF